MTQEHLPSPGPAPAHPAPAGRFPYLDALNPQQRLAAETLDGPVLVLAGAGTGKTRVLTARLAHLVATRRAAPWQILAVTFTNKAAREMRERVSALLGQPVEGWWMGTFHSVAARILRENADLVGLKPTYTILDADDQIRLLKQVLQAEGVDDKRWPARAMAGVIDRWKDRALTPDRLKADDAGDLAGGRMVAVYAAYQDRLRTLNACDFGDLLLHTITVFQAHQDVLGRWQRRFRYILVDEYQDTNVAQYLWLRLLAQEHRNLCCVGDDDQCVVAGTRISMADGTLRPVEAVRPGDLVLSAYGGGRFGPARVSDVFRRRVSRETITIRTAAGSELTTTPEHTHFADVILHESPQKHFVYLMHRRGSGYRLGTSQVYTRGERHPVIGYQQRCLQERADAVWLVGAFGSENDAREWEHRLSLRYGITTLPFVARAGGSTAGLVHDQKRLDELHAEFAQTARVVELMEAHGLDPATPHYVPQSEPGRRRNLTLTLNAESRGPTPMHRIAMSGNDEDGARALADLGLKARTYRRNPRNWRYETLFRDYSRLEEIKARLATRFDLTVVCKGNILGKALTMRPAANVVPGMVVAMADGRHDVVVDVARAPYAGEVYDLNVEGTHNFVAEGVVTHNSIYGWRGAEVGNILRFEHDFPGAAVIRLEENYRSTGHILGAASGVIAHNRGRLGKTLWTGADAGEKVRVRAVWDGEDEARWVGEEIEALQRRGVRPGQVAVLVRAGFQTREFEERFITLGLPYRVLGGPRFYERQEIRDALAYLRLVHSPDDDLAFERIVNTPKRGVGPAAMQLINRTARSLGVPMAEAVWELCRTDELKPKLRATLRGFVEDLARWRAGLETTHHPELAKAILDESGYTAMWQADKSPEAPGRLENLKELVAALAEFETLGGFLEHVSLVMEAAEAAPGDQVTLMTLHGAKGLEFDVVFLPGWEEGVFPNQRALDESGVAGLEEERRLAYVGLTRARRIAMISHAANRRVFGTFQTSIPSRFVDELPKENVEHEADPGLYAGGGAWGGTGSSRLAEAGPSGNPLAPFARGFRPPPPRREGPLIEGSAFEVPARPPPDVPFAVGDRVFHQKRGYGTVVATNAPSVDVEFDHTGRKMVLESYLKRAEDAG